MSKPLTYEERIQIETLLKEKYKPYQIADKLHRSRQTIYNEIKRGSVDQEDTNLIIHHIYKADYAQRIHRLNLSNRGTNLKVGADLAYIKKLEELVLKKHYSPFAVLQYIRNNNLKFKTTICKTTFYSYIQKGIFLNIGYKDLPYGERKKKKKNEEIRTSWKNVKGESISKRSAGANDRSEFGHWEGDTVVSGKGDKSCLLVLTERKTRQELIRKIPNREAATVLSCFRKIKKDLTKCNYLKTIKSITFDNGSEFSLWGKIGEALKADIYFAHPYRACERGTNENQNRIIRRFIPKGSSISTYTDTDIQQIEDWINDMPRKILDGQSSSMLFKECVNHSI